MKRISWLWRGVFLLPTLFYLVIVFLLFVKGETKQLYFNLIFWLTLCIVLPVFFFTVISLIGRGFGLLNPLLRITFDWIGIGIALIWLGISVYGITYGWRNITIEKLDLSFNSLPKEFDGYKIVQLSDQHIGTYDLAPETVTKIVNQVNSLHPDLIVFTGDIVNSSPEELDRYIDVLSDLKATDGVISILGNHDYCLYRNYENSDDNPAKSLERVEAKEKAMGWQLLLNESRIIKRGENEIAVIGVENSGGKNFIDRSDLRKALNNIPEDDFKILLSHDPSHWRREVLPNTNVNLTLSGHTHAMQFKLGNFSPSKWTYKEWGGLYNENGRMLHVNTGTGGNIAFRFGAYPQITLITLRKD